MYYLIYRERGVFMSNVLMKTMFFLTDTKVIDWSDPVAFCSNSDVQEIIKLVKIIYTILLIAIPILLIIFGLLDLGKAVMAGKEDEMKKAQGALIKRVIYTVLAF